MSMIYNITSNEGKKQITEKNKKHAKKPTALTFSPLL